MSEAVTTITPGEAERVLRERSENFATNQSAQPAPSAPAPVVEGASEEVSLDELAALVDLANVVYAAVGIEGAISKEAGDHWCKTAKPIAEKYGGHLPFFREINFALTSLVVFGPPSILAVRALRAPVEKPAPKTVDGKVTPPADKTIGPGAPAP